MANLYLEKMKYIIYNKTLFITPSRVLQSYLTSSLSADKLNKLINIQPQVINTYNQNFHLLIYLLNYHLSLMKNNLTKI